MRSSYAAALLLTTAIAVVGVRSAAQVPPGPPQGRGGPPQAPKNLQVLPKDWTTQQVTQLMRTFTLGLGVQCDHCHVSQQDRASDDKKPKLTARKMIAMMMAINDQYLKDVGDAPEAAPQPPPAAAAAPAPQGPPPLPAMKVTCYTCHRGTLKPLTVPPPAGGGL